MTGGGREEPMQGTEGKECEMITFFEEVLKDLK